MQKKQYAKLEVLADNVFDKYDSLSGVGISEELDIDEIYDDSLKMLDELAQNITVKEKIDLEGWKALPMLAEAASIAGLGILNKELFGVYLDGVRHLIKKVVEKGEEEGIIEDYGEIISKTDVLILVPLKEEINEFVNIFYCDDSYHRVGTAKLYFSTINNVNITIIQPKYMGQTDATAAASMILEKAKPKYVIIAGIAAGFDKGDQNLGDVLIPDSILHYDRIRKVKDGSEGGIITDSNADIYKSSLSLVQSLDDFYNKSPLYKMWKIDNQKKINSVQDFSEIPNVLIGETLASADEVQASEAVIKKLTSFNRKLIGQDMESAGVHVASNYYDNECDIVTIRGISDWGANKEDLEEDTGGKIRKYAARRCASFIKSYLNSDQFKEIIA